MYVRLAAHTRHLSHGLFSSCKARMHFKCIRLEFSFQPMLREGKKIDSCLCCLLSLHQGSCEDGGCSTWTLMHGQEFYAAGCLVNRFAYICTMWGRWWFGDTCHTSLLSSMPVIRIAEKKKRSRAWMSHVKGVGKRKAVLGVTLMMLWAQPTQSVTTWGSRHVLQLFPPQNIRMFCIMDIIFIQAAFPPERVSAHTVISLLSLAEPSNPQSTGGGDGGCSLSGR